MFYSYKHFNTYKNIVTAINGEEDLYLPLEVDTEFQQPHYPFLSEKEKQKLTISVQIKPIMGEPSFFLHQDMKKYVLKGNNTVIQEDFCIVDFLKKRKYEVFFLETKEPYTPCKILHIDFYGFFLLADVLRLFDKTWLEDILYLIRNPSKERGAIKHERRLKCQNFKNSRFTKSFINLGKFLQINGHVYEIVIEFKDNCALQGVQTYKTLCENTNITMEKKKLIQETEKKHMLEVFRETPDRFIEYAQGDLMNYHAYQGHAELFRSLYEILGLKDEYVEPLLTIGSSVNNLLLSALQKNFKFENKTLFIKHLEHATHKTLIENKQSTQVYIAKTSGGRCYNNRPTEPSIEGPVVDIDIKGCYGQGLKNQQYPIGRPIILDYKIKSNINLYNTLETFLKSYQKELVEGLWFCRISTTEDLTFDQDYFLSWYPPEKLSDIIKTDMHYEVEGEFNNGYTNIYSRQLHLSPLETEGLNWIEHCLTKQEREEFLSKTVVIAAGFYPKTCKCKTLEEYHQRRTEHTGENTCQIKLKEKQTIKQTYEENYFWYSDNLGDILITNLQKKRALYKKEDPTQNLMNKFIKLIINTVYGDIVSPYFQLGNTIVGNNITGRARAMAWYMEKALHGTQTITDGCCFELNRVVKSRYALTNIKYNRIKRLGKQKDLTLGPLLERKIRNQDRQNLDLEKIAKKTKEHIQKTFPRTKIIAKFELEVKEVVTGLSTHGASNYQTHVDDKITNTKMRSYKNKKYIIYDPKTKKIKGEKNRIESWLNSIYKNPNKVYREEPFVEENIIKTNDYRKQIIRFEEERLLPGDIDYKVRLINECVLSMFLFKTHNQYKSWKAEYERTRRIYGQSYESYYTNKEGFLNYKKMITDIQKKLEKGKLKYKNTEAHKEDHPRREEYADIEKHIKEEIRQIC